MVTTLCCPFLFCAVSVVLPPGTSIDSDPINARAIISVRTTASREPYIVVIEGDTPERQGIYQRTPAPPLRLHRIAELDYFTFPIIVPDQSDVEFGVRKDRTASGTVLSITSLSADGAKTEHECTVEAPRFGRGQGTNSPWGKATPASVGVYWGICLGGEHYFFVGQFDDIFFHPGALYTGEFPSAVKNCSLVLSSDGGDWQRIEKRSRSSVQGDVYVYSAGRIWSAWIRVKPDKHSTAESAVFSSCIPGQPWTTPAELDIPTEGEVIQVSLAYRQSGAPAAVSLTSESELCFISDLGNGPTTVYPLPVANSDIAWDRWDRAQFFRLFVLPDGRIVLLVSLVDGMLIVPLPGEASTHYVVKWDKAPLADAGVECEMDNDGQFQAAYLYRDSDGVRIRSCMFQVPVLPQ